MQLNDGNHSAYCVDKSSLVKNRRGPGVPKSSCYARLWRPTGCQEGITGRSEAWKQKVQDAKFSKVRFAFLFFIPFANCCLSVVQVKTLGCRCAVEGARGVKRIRQGHHGPPVQGRLRQPQPPEKSPRGRASGKGVIIPTRQGLPVATRSKQVQADSMCSARISQSPHSTPRRPRHWGKRYACDIPHFGYVPPSAMAPWVQLRYCL